MANFKVWLASLNWWPLWALAICVGLFFFIQPAGKSPSGRVMISERRLQQALLANVDGKTLFPGDLPVTTVKEYLELVINSGRLKQATLYLFSSRHHLPATSLATFTDEQNNGFIIYRVKATDPNDTPFLASKETFGGRHISINKSGAISYISDSEALRFSHSAALTP